MSSNIAASWQKKAELCNMAHIFCPMFLPTDTKANNGEDSISSSLPPGSRDTAGVNNQNKKIEIAQSPTVHMQSKMLMVP